MVDIDSLSANSAWWSRVDIAALLVVTIGVVLEGIAEWLPKERKETRCMTALTRTGWLILVLALVVEFIAQRNKDASDALITAALNDRAQSSERDTEKLKSNNLALEKEVAPRRIDPDKCATYMLDAVKQSPPITVRVSTYSLDMDGGIFGWQIGACLTRAKIDVDWEAASILPIGAFGVGVFVSGEDESLVAAIKTALERSGVRIMDGTGLFLPNQVTLRPGAPTNPAANVVVGIKPPIDMK